VHLPDRGRRRKCNRDAERNRECHKDEFWAHHAASHFHLHPTDIWRRLAAIQTPARNLTSEPDCGSRGFIPLRGLQEGFEDGSHSGTICLVRACAFSWNLLVANLLSRESRPIECFRLGAPLCAFAEPPASTSPVATMIAVHFMVIPFDRSRTIPRKTLGSERDEAAMRS
jgi:hypothetical protein